jgi:hypothetical protein
LAFHNYLKLDEVGTVKADAKAFNKQTIDYCGKLPQSGLELGFWGKNSYLPQS